MKLALASAVLLSVLAPTFLVAGCAGGSSHHTAASREASSAEINHGAQDRPYVCQKEMFAFVGVVDALQRGGTSQADLVDKIGSQSPFVLLSADIISEYDRRVQTAPPSSAAVYALADAQAACLQHHTPVMTQGQLGTMRTYYRQYSPNDSTYLDDITLVSDHALVLDEAPGDSPTPTDSGQAATSDTPTPTRTSVVADCVSGEVLQSALRERGSRYDRNKVIAPADVGGGPMIECSGSYAAATFVESAGNAERLIFQERNGVWSEVPDGFDCQQLPEAMRACN